MAQGLLEHDDCISVDTTISSSIRTQRVIAVCLAAAWSVAQTILLPWYRSAL